MGNTIKVRVRRKGDVSEVKSLVRHPMETGARKNPDTGEFVPRHHITQLTFALNGKHVLIADCSTAVARNPYFEFSFVGARPGDTFTVRWEDTNGESDSFETMLD